MTSDSERRGEVVLGEEDGRTDTLSGREAPRHHSRGVSNAHEGGAREGAAARANERSGVQSNAPFSRRAARQIHSEDGGS